MERGMYWIRQSGDWRLEVGEWRVESGEWRVEIGEWRVESGEWRVGSGDWRFEFRMKYGSLAPLVRAGLPIQTQFRFRSGRE